MTKRSAASFLIVIAVALMVFGFQSPSPALGNMEPTLTPTLTPSPTPVYLQVGSFSPCKNRVDVPEEEMNWLYVPQSAAELQTAVNYAFLAGQLIQAGAVDVATCPAGGLGAEGYANACGLARAKPLVIELQNAYDQAIMDAWEKVGVPPVMMKQLLRYESQFWPGRWGEYHYGLGHLTYFGAHTGLSWRQPLRNEICALTGTCNLAVVTDPEVTTLLGLMDASCPTCAEKVDLPKAQRSIYYLAEVLLGHCYQTSQVVFNATGITSNAVVDYATIWRLTLFDYNAGPMCVYSAVKEAYKQNPGAMTWSDISHYITGAQCERGATYVYQITERFYNFPPE